MAHADALGTIAAVLLIPQLGAVRFRPDPGDGPGPGDDGATPVPERDSVFGDDDAVLVIVSEPL